MRIAVVGANGLTGFHVVRAALAGGREVIPVVRDERDQYRVGPSFPAGEVRYANPEHEAALRAALDGATHVVASLDPRGQGPGAPWVAFDAAPNVVKAANAVGIEKIVLVSVAGAWRWAPFRLNRRAFHMDRLTRLVPGPKTLIRVSCYHDEVLEGHVRPPDGLQPRPIPRNGQYSPISRRDVGRAILAILERQPAGRLFTIGGPRLYTAMELTAAVGPHLQPGRGGPTTFPGLPPGDLGVQPETTWASCRWMPEETLESYLTGQALAGEGERRPF